MQASAAPIRERTQGVGVETLIGDDDWNRPVMNESVLMGCNLLQGLGLPPPAATAPPRSQADPGASQQTHLRAVSPSGNT